MCKMHGIALLLVGLCALPLGQALFQDQAGTYDWYKSLVGHVLGGAFQKNKPRVFVATEQGAVSSLNLRDGSIAWRHKLDDGEVPIASLFLDSQGLFVTLSGSTLRAWEHADGSLAWQVSVGKTTDKPALAFVPGAHPSIAVVAGGQIQLFDADKGTQKESVSLTDQAAGAAITHVQSSGSELVAFAYKPGGDEVRVYAGVHGAATPTTLSAPAPLSALSAAGPAGLAVLSADYEQICTAPLAAGNEQGLFCQSLRTLGLTTALTADAQLVATAHGWAVASGSPAAPGALLIKREGSSVSGLPAKEYGKAGSAVSGAVATTGDAEHVAVAEVGADGAVSVFYVNTKTGETSSREGPIKASPTGTGHARGAAVSGAAAGSALKRLVLGSFKKKDGSDGFRLLLVWGDEHVSLAQQGVTVWVRDEALAGVTKAMFADLPAAGSVGAPAPATAFADFLRLQLLSAKVQFKVASPAEEEEARALRAELSDRNTPTRDSRGFRRAILVATASGRVAALHNGDGRTLWAREFGRAGAAKHLLPWASFHDLTHAPRAALLAPGPESGGALSTALTVVDTYAGHVVEQYEVPHHVDKVVSLGVVAEGAAEQRVYLGVRVPTSAQELPTVVLLPDTPLARQHFASHARTTFFWLDTSAIEGAPALQGFGFDAAAVAALTAGAPATAARAWALALPQPLLAVAARDPAEPSHSSVKVLGDRSIKYRYLNPNTLVVVSGLAPGQPEPRDDLTAAHIMLVDAVTGRVLHSQSAPGARGPATALLSENTAVVQLWDSSSARFTVTSLEAYDATPRPPFSVSALLDTLLNPNATAPWSSLSPPPLEVLSQVYSTHTPAKALATTLTRAGITSKMMLAATHNDQVYALDARFVDPRRPRKAKLSAEEQEERLIPYQEALPLQPTSFASMDKRVVGLRGMLSAPARLESTSLLFFWGLDLQYTRIAPAKGFDSLDDDFSYGLLVVALIGLTVAAVVLRWYTRRAQLAAKWL